MEAFGFVRPEPEDVVPDAERPIVLLAGRLAELEIVEEALLARLGHVYAESFRRIALAETEVYHTGVEVPLLRSGVGESRAMELASSLSPALTGMLDEPHLTIRVWTELSGEVIERRLDASDHAIQVRRMTGMVENLDLNLLPHLPRAQSRGA